MEQMLHWGVFATKLTSEALLTLSPAVHSYLTTLMQVQNLMTPNLDAVRFSEADTVMVLEGLYLMLQSV
ncbi:hypothetical protein [Paenibacillus sp. 7541]|uniref:hypothetical protein n=1 Tax=Paenibacillus sp. 7541 TaxID=2026236 RepID=UPI001140CC53|nr:hypothetical protein [Paenibacillus sp. 7541]